MDKELAELDRSIAELKEEEVALSQFVDEQEIALGMEPKHDVKNWDLIILLSASRRVLQSYQYGNKSPDFATKMVNKIDETFRKMGVQ